MALPGLMGLRQLFLDRGPLQTAFGDFKYVLHQLYGETTMNKILDLVCLLLYCLFIFWLSDQASLNVPMWFSHQDKIYHAGAYFIMAVLAWRTFRHTFSKPWIFALLFCSLYGLSDEWHQSFVAGRYSDISDWLADTAGTSLALLYLEKFTSTDKLG